MHHSALWKRTFCCFRGLDSLFSLSLQVIHALCGTWTQDLTHSKTIGTWTQDKWGGLLTLRFPANKWLHENISLIFLSKNDSAWSWDLQACTEDYMWSCAGTYFAKALFVPSMSAYNKVTSGASIIPSDVCGRDLSWQFYLQRLWEKIIHGKGMPHLFCLLLSFAVCLTGRQFHFIFLHQVSLEITLCNLSLFVLEYIL